MAADLLAFGCHGLFLLGKAWDRMPPIVARTANAYLSVSALVYLPQSIRILRDRIQLTGLSLQLGNRQVACYTALDALNCTLSIFLSIGYTWAALTSKTKTGAIYQRLKPIGMVSLIVGITCTLWTRWLVAKTSYTLATYPPSTDENIRLISAFLSPTQRHPLAAAVVASLHMEIRQKISQASERTFQKVKKHLNTRVSQANTSLQQAVVYFGQQYVSRNHPDTLLLASVNFVINLYFMAKKIGYFLEIRRQKKQLSLQQHSTQV